MIRRQLIFVLLLLPLLCDLSFAATLYEHSLAQLKATEKKVNRKDYTFIVLGDSRGGGAVFRKALKLARSYHPLFIVHGGDYSNRGGEKETAEFLSLVRETVPDVPVFVVFGNHEDRAVFAREIGPFDFTLRSKRLGLVFVAVDNSAYALKRQELDYLRNALSSEAKNRFVAMHVPPRTDRWTWHVFDEGAEALEKILADTDVDAVFFSHVHLFDRYDFGGVPAIITGGAGGPLTTFAFPGDPVNHIVVVRVKDGNASFTKVPIAK